MDYLETQSVDRIIELDKHSEKIAAELKNSG